MRTTFGALALVLVLAGRRTSDPLDEEGSANATTTTVAPTTTTLAPTTTTVAWAMDLSYEDLAYADLFGAFAEYESELIADRARMTHRRRKAAGHRAGQAPILSDELRHRIADTRLGGASFGAIADELNAEGIPTARGGRWHASTVRHVCVSVERDAELAGTMEAAA